MNCKMYKYEDMVLTEAQLIQVLSTNIELVESFKSQEEREGTDYEREQRATFEQKVEALKKTMNVEVIYDENIESSRVLGKNDPRTKAAGKPVIVINPNQLFKTTAIHEFGHVFIDSFPGGLQNKRIQKALNELRDTELWAEVEALYPELSEDMLHKEILVTAIGREGSEIWADEQKRNSWESFIAWFADFIRRTFGLERSEVVSLSKELLNNKVKAVDVTKIEEIAQQLKPIFVNKEKADENQTEASKGLKTLEQKVEDKYKKLLATITKVYKNQSSKITSKAAQKKENVNARKLGKIGKKTRLGSIKELQDELNEFDKTDKKLGFIKYIDWARGELYFMESTLDIRSEQGELGADTLRKAYDWAASFTILEDISALAEEIKDSDFLTEEESKTLRNSMIELNGIKANIDAKLLQGSRKVYSELLAKHDTETEEQYKLGFKKDWEDLQKIGGDGRQEGEYVLAKMQENKDEIEDRKLQLAEERAETSLTKMSGLSMQLLSEKEMKAKDIQLISKMLDQASSNIEKYSIEEATAEDKAHKEFRDNVSNARNMKKKYEDMFTVSESGIAYYTTEFKPEFIEKKNELQREAGDSDIYDEKYKDVKVEKVTDKNGVVSFHYESTIPDPVTGKTSKRKLTIAGGNEIQIEGIDSLKDGERPMHVSYKMKNNKRNTISLNEAIARSEMNVWLKLNTEQQQYVNKNGYTVTRNVPHKVWKNPVWDKLQTQPKKKAELERLMENNRIADKRYEKNDSIIETYRAAEFMRLPGIMKSGASRIAEGQSIATMGKNAISRLVETQKDDFDVQTYTNFKEGETLRLPRPYRAKLNESDQSFDLHTIGLLNSIMAKNFEEKKSIESTLLIITETMAEKKYPVLDSVSGKQKIDAQTGLPLWTSGSKSKEYEKALSMIENRLYSITTKQAGGFKVAGKTVETQQVVKAGLKYFGTVSLVFNYANSIVNTFTGTFSNLIEAIGGDIYNLKDYKRAQQLYNFDLKNIMADFGANVKTSRTNLLMSNFNTMGPSNLNSRFEAGTRMEGLMNQDSLRPLSNSGEHMMQGKVMYSVLSSIKAQNDKGQWIDSAGNVVDSKSKAASLDQMISFKTNARGGQEMVLDPKVQNTSFTTGGGQEAILLEARNLIRSKVDELHGQYTNDIQAHAQRYMLGKMGFFLRKWMIPGYLRRFRGITTSFKPSDAELSEADLFYSADQKEHMEGYYISTARFLSKLINDAREDGINVAKSWKELTPKQRAGVRKTLADVAFMTMITIAYGILEGDGDIDDEDIFLAYLLRRQQSELTTFLNPVEAFKIAQTPTAAVGNFKQIFKTMNYMTPWTWGERYKVGPYKDELKLKHKAKKLLPRFKNIEDFRESLDFLRTMNM